MKIGREIDISDNKLLINFVTIIEAICSKHFSKKKYEFNFKKKIVDENDQNGLIIGKKFVNTLFTLVEKLIVHIIFRKIYVLRSLYFCFSNILNIKKSILNFNFSTFFL